MTAILAIHAHPDDVETLAAGTLALLAHQGHAITIVTVTAGECGALDGDAADTGRIRQDEARAAAAMIGAAYHCVGVGDLAVFNDDASRRRVTEMVRRAAPDLVLTSAPADYHPDHEATSVLVRDACFAASAPRYRTGPAPALGAMPHLYFMDPIGGRDREGLKVIPDFAVDIGPWIETKRRMLAAHESQAAWLLKQHGIDDPVDSMLAWSRRRGRDFGVGHAEGFRQYRNEPYPRSPLLQDLLGAAVLRASRP
jgi:LmbE family N-acetylglucosaminyl deacetylase